MRIFNYIYFLVGLLLFSACEKIVELEIPNEEPRVTIVSQITNEKEPWKVHLSLSQPYFNQDEAIDVSSATVNISSSTGVSEDLIYTDSGVFVSEGSVECFVGETYTLTVSYNGESYTASEILPNGFPIDTIVSFFLPSTNGFIEEGYYIFIKGEENEYKGDSYFWNFYKNDTLQETFGSLIENDEFGSVSYLNPNIDPEDPLKGLAQNILPRPFPFIVEPGDSIYLEQYNLSPEYYNYRINLDAQLARSGSPFDPPPANPSNNISNGAVGYFSVAHKVVKTIVVAE